MIAGEWYVTSHAIHRFIERHGASTGCRTRRQALSWIIADSAIAKRAHAISRTGFEIWVGQRPQRIRYTIGPATDPRNIPVVVTVLPNRRNS